MEIDEMIRLFSTEGLLRKAAVFDPQKLEWMNGQHLTLMPAERLEPRVTPAIAAAELATPEELAARREGDLSLGSEEHTSEHQARQYIVCRLLLGKKNNT